MEHEIVDVSAGITEADVPAMKRAQKAIRDAVAMVPGADQEESRLRAFAAAAAVFVAMTGCPVEILWYQRPDFVRRCSGDGKVKSFELDGDVPDRLHS